MNQNEEIARELDAFADLLSAKDVEFKPRSYRRAAETIRTLSSPIENVAAEGQDALEELDAVGEAIAAKIIEYIATGEIGELEELREELPVDMPALLRVEGVGPKTVGALFEALDVRTLDDLEAAADAGEIQTVSGFGAKTEQNILENIPFARRASERALLGDAVPLGEDVVDNLASLPVVDACEVAGSLRRWRATIGDVDVLVGTTKPGRVVEAFQDWDRVEAVIEAGETKVSVRVSGLRVDLRVVVPEEFGSALQYFTGSKDHNVVLRNRAIERGYKMNEYGVFDVSAVDEKGERVGTRVAGVTEVSMYEALELPWIPPELRENRGEIEAAIDGSLPSLLEREDVRGDLHVHTDWSDGAESIEAIVAGAAAFEHEFVCITDHASGPGIIASTGVDDDSLLEQRDAVAAVDDDADVRVFHGVEANIDADGGLSVRDDVLAELDVVIASPHSALDMSGADATQRLVTAIEHPAVDVLGHPTGRLLNRREGMSFDVAAVASAAADNDVALEVNSNPARLDLSGSSVKTAIEHGAVLAIDTDAHHTADFELVTYGVHTARRGWAEPEHVVNTWSLDDVEAFLT